MSDVRRALLWGIFSISLIMLWDGWQRHRGQPSMFDPTPVAQTAAAPASGPAGVLPTPSTGAAATPGAPAVAPAAAPAPSQTVTLETDVMKATFDSRGGSLVRLELLKHRGIDADGHMTADNLVLMDRSAVRYYTAESGLIAANGAALPNHLTDMQVEPGERALADGRDEVSLTFVSPDVNGVKLRKTYTLKRGSYVVDVEETVANDGTAAVAPQLYLQLVRDGNVPKTSTFMGPSSYTGPGIYSAERYHKVDFKHVEEQAAGSKPDFEQRSETGWVAMVQHYFTSAWLVNQKQAREFYTQKTGVNQYAVGMKFPLGDVAPGASKSLKAQLYAGPQEEKRLEALAPGFELVKDYGFLALLAKPLFWLLDWLHTIIGNWGWAIVALVVLLKAAFFWLNASAYRSMAKMKAVNPKVQELRERLKDNPQKMQQEMMRIYREEKVNPLGGCLPIFIQMPFFIALYWVLLSSVEMRNAPWIGWIHDLSALDPYYILPLVMTGSTMLQTWLNPTPPDPVQARMMWIMPLVFSVMFFFFPAGLVLYWVTNNLLSIAQQWVINRQLGVKH